MVLPKTGSNQNKTANSLKDDQSRFGRHDWFAAASFRMWNTLPSSLRLVDYALGFCYIDVFRA